MFAVLTGKGRYFDESEPLGKVVHPASVAIAKAATVSLISEFILGSFCLFSVSAQIVSDFLFFMRK
jgi:hypothetical protein